MGHPLCKLLYVQKKVLVTGLRRTLHDMSIQNAHACSCYLPAELTAPAPLVSDVAARAAAAGLIPGADDWAPGSAAWSLAWDAIKQVWASKWTERAWLSRKARGVKDSDLYMAALLQQVGPRPWILYLVH